MRIDLTEVDRVLEGVPLIPSGKVTRVTSNTVEAILPRAQTGAIYCITRQAPAEDLLTEVIGFSDNHTILAPFGEPRGIRPGDPVAPEGVTDQQWVSNHYLGRVIDALGKPIDGGPSIPGTSIVPLYRSPPNPMLRLPIDRQLTSGISIVDTITPIGEGQRIGIFAGAGVGKTTLMGMLCRSSTADINIIALVGERGREVKGFIDREIGKEAIERSVILVATGDMAPILRVRVAFLATSLAEYFRDHGKKVLLMMDSITRFAHALREIGLSAGEPPTTKGYPPSVFSTLPKLVERAGMGEKIQGIAGSITALYTVLVDGDDPNDPVADAVRSLLDGHILLSRKIAETGRYPAVDISRSLSRIADEITDKQLQRIALRIRSSYAIFEEVRDLVQVGAYRPGTDPETDRALRLVPKLNDFFNQDRNEKRPLEKTLGSLEALLGSELRK